MYDNRDTMEATADLGPEDLWGMILRGYVCRTSERRVFVLVLLAAEDVVGEMASAVTTVDTIFLEANALDLLERHGRTRNGGGEAKMSSHRSGGAPQGLSAVPRRRHHRSQTPARCIL